MESIDATQDFVVTPAAGFVVARVTLDGVIVSPNAGTTDTYTVGYKSGVTNRNLLAYFAVPVYSITVSLGSGGSYKTDPVGQTLTSIPAGSSRTILIIPYYGNQIDSISAPGGVIGDVNNGTGTKSVTYSSITANMAISATFKLIPVLVAKAGPDLTTQGNSAAYPVVLDGSLSTSNMGAITYNWSATGPGTGVFSSASAQKPTFYSTTPGAYTVSLSITSGGAVSAPDTAVITVVSRTAFREQQCSSCHLYRTPEVIKLYDASRHKTAFATPFVDCQICHDPTNTGHYTIASPVDSCTGCHTDVPGVPGHLLGINTCTTCHNAHSGLLVLGTVHYSNITSNMYPASYVTSRAECTNCHQPNTTNSTVRQQWSQSAHAATNEYAWMKDDFKTLSGCVQCHTTTGFIAYSTSRVTAAWGTSSDKTKEVLACNGCHLADFSVRPFAPYSAAAAYTVQKDSTTIVSSIKFGNYQTSNLCIPCHSGTTSGAVIKKAFQSPTFSNFTAAGRFQNHFMVGGGIMENYIGYEFEGTPRSNYQDYNKQNTWHAGIGSPSSVVDTGSSGPCVSCHMNPGKQHVANAVFKNTTGSITGVTAQAQCDKCHPSVLGGGDQMTAGTLNSLRSNFSSALLALKAQLKVSGFDPDSAAPKNWGTTPLELANNMGASYNYFLLRDSDAGSYVHNPTYAKRLIQYSIDWLDDNNLNDSVANTLDTLHATGRLSSSVRDSAITYLELNSDVIGGNCMLCHKDYYNQ